MPRAATIWRIGALCLALARMASAEEPSSAGAERVDDTGRLYFQALSGADFVLDSPFAGDVEIDKNPDDVLGGSLGYNISRSLGLELQFQGTEPDLRSASHGKVREISVITAVPAVRYRWHLADDRLVPYVTGGVGVALTQVNEFGKPGTKAHTDDATIVGSVSAGVEYFFADDVAVGVEGRYLIHPDQSTDVSFQEPGGRVQRYEGTLNLTSISLLGQVRLFLGQQADSTGNRTLFLATHGPFDTAERRFYLSGLFGYDFLFNRDAGAGVRMRDKGGDFNLTRGGALGINFDGHWGAEVQVVVTSINLHTSQIDKIAEVNDAAILPTVRYRWQLLQGRLVPYVTAGLGVGYLTVNDPRIAVDVGTPRGGTTTVKSPKWDAENPIVMGAVGAGFEYFLNRHFSMGVYAPFHIYPRTDVTVREANGTISTDTVSFSGFVVFLQLKAYLP